MKIGLAIVLFLCFSAPALAQPLRTHIFKTLSLQQPFDTKSDWHVAGYQSDEPDAEMGDVSAQICFWVSAKPLSCTAIVSTLQNSSAIYHYQTIKKLSVVTVAGAPLVAFVTEYSGGGSGVLDQVSFWQYDKQQDAFEQAGIITLTGESEYRFEKNILLTADAVQQYETHFSPHRFYVEAYRYVPDSGFIKLLGYLTQKTYPSFDNVDKIQVITPELPQIHRLLGVVAK